MSIDLRNMTPQQLQILQLHPHLRSRAPSRGGMKRKLGVAFRGLGPGVQAKNTFTDYGLTTALATMFENGDPIDSLSCRTNDGTVLKASLNTDFPQAFGNVVRYQFTFIPSVQTTGVTSINVFDGTDKVWETEITSFAVSTSVDPPVSPVTIEANNRYTFSWDITGAVDLRFPDEASQFGTGDSALRFDLAGRDLVRQIAGLQSRPFDNPDIQLWGPDPASGLPPMEVIFPEFVILRELITNVAASTSGNETTFTFHMPRIVAAGLWSFRYACLIVDQTLVLGVEEIGNAGPRPTADTDASTAVFTLIP